MADGLLLLLPYNFEAYSELLSQRRFPHVLIDYEGSAVGPAISCSNRQGAYDGASYLLSLGHRRLGFITGNLAMGSSRSRLAGYRQALSDHGVVEDPALVVEGDYLQPSGYAGAHTLFALPEPPTAVFASNDVMAFGAMEAIREAGLRIPQDISVLGFDDIPQAAGVAPALTTVRQPLHEMGRQAVQMLLSYIENPDRPFEYRELPTSLAIRSSCAPVRGTS
jgi:LacI family transcriptional regulator